MSFLQDDNNCTCLRLVPIMPNMSPGETTESARCGSSSESSGATTSLGRCGTGRFWRGARVCLYRHMRAVFPSRRGNKYILVVTDQATLWTEAFPMLNQDAGSVCKILMVETVCRFGVMRQIHPDQGRRFGRMCTRFGIKKSRTSPHHPQRNPQAERFMRTLGNMLRSDSSKNHAE